MSCTAAIHAKRQNFLNYIQHYSENIQRRCFNYFYDPVTTAKQQEDHTSTVWSKFLNCFQARQSPSGFVLCRFKSQSWVNRRCSGMIGC